MIVIKYRLFIIIKDKEALEKYLKEIYRVIITIKEETK